MHCFSFVVKGGLEGWLFLVERREVGRSNHYDKVVIRRTVLIAARKEFNESGLIT